MNTFNRSQPLASFNFINTYPPTYDNIAYDNNTNTPWYSENSIWRPFSSANAKYDTPNLAPSYLKAAKGSFIITGSGDTPANTLYYTDGINWQQVAIATGAIDWHTIGNAGTNSATNFVGTTDNTNFNIAAGGLTGPTITLGTDGRIGLANTGVGTDVNNVIIGGNAGAPPPSAFGPGANCVLIGYNVHPGIYSYEDVAIGYESQFGCTGLFSQDSNTSIGTRTMRNMTNADGCVAIGKEALMNINTGRFNVSIGNESSKYNVGGTQNAACGYMSMYGFQFSPAASNFNAAFGTYSLQGIAGGSGNCAFGGDCMISTRAGNGNSAMGYQALSNNFNGSGNTAVGYQASLFSTNTSEVCAFGYQTLRSNNNSPATAYGYSALFSNTSGDGNTAFGNRALYTNTTSSNSTALGYRALNLSTGGSNTGVGYNALVATTTGVNNIAFGANAGSLQTTGSNSIYIGHVGVAAESNTIRIGTIATQNRFFSAGIRGIIPAGLLNTDNTSTLPLIIDSLGQVGSMDVWAKRVVASGPLFTSGIPLATITEIPFTSTSDTSGAITITANKITFNKPGVYTWNFNFQLGYTGGDGTTLVAWHTESLGFGSYAASVLAYNPTVITPGQEYAFTGLQGNLQKNDSLAQQMTVQLIARVFSGTAPATVSVGRPECYITYNPFPNF